MRWNSRPSGFVLGVLVKSSVPRTSSRILYRRHYHDGRQRLSSVWIPTKRKDTAAAVTEDANSLLIRAGFLRQAYSGIFHLLPLGLRVQEKLEQLIDKHMRSVGAAKVSLSSVSSQQLWEQSGRLQKGSEFFQFADRKGSGFLLSPTHEEEITQLVAHEVQSYRDLPLRLYQVTRKYRDEKRPRGGLLRGREFLMKDLYTFDKDEQSAITTYEHVRKAYDNFFDELRVPYLVANADSGAMGGDLSHEYHFPNEKGEDDVISCDTCGSVRNEELVDVPAVIISTHSTEASSGSDGDVSLRTLTQLQHISRWESVTDDGLGKIEVYVPKPYDVNPYLIKALVPNLDLSGASDWKALQQINSSDPSINQQPDIPVEGTAGTIFEGTKADAKPYRLVLFDSRVDVNDRQTILQAVQTESSDISLEHDLKTLEADHANSSSLNLMKPIDGDACPKCSTGKLTVQKAIEVGHTFYLGTRYSEPLNLKVASTSAAGASADDQALIPVQMGCHGIGISRLISAVASCLVDAKGLNWPRAMAPFEVIVIPGKGHDDSAAEIYDKLATTPSGQQTPGTQLQSSRTPAPHIDAAIDDRPGKDLIWKLKDADLVGYPVVVVLGRAFGKGEVEVQCRRLGVKENVKIEAFRDHVLGLLAQL